MGQSGVDDPGSRIMLRHKIDGAALLEESSGSLILPEMKTAGLANQSLFENDPLLQFRADGGLNRRDASYTSRIKFSIKD